MDKYVNANAIFSIFCSSYTILKKELPIRPSEMGVLNIIVQRDGLFTPLMIAELLGVSKPMITTHITILEKKGYIVKKYSKDDRRSFYVIPTDKAKDLVISSVHFLSLIRKIPYIISFKRKRRQAPKSHINASIFILLSANSFIFSNTCADWDIVSSLSSVGSP